MPRECSCSLFVVICLSNIHPNKSDLSYLSQGPPFTQHICYWGGRYHLLIKLLCIIMEKLFALTPFPIPLDQLGILSSILKSSTLILLCRPLRKHSSHEVGSCQSHAILFQSNQELVSWPHKCYRYEIPSQRVVYLNNVGAHPLGLLMLGSSMLPQF